MVVSGSFARLILSPPERIHTRWKINHEPSDNIRRHARRARIVTSSDEHEEAGWAEDVRHVVEEGLITYNDFNAVGNLVTVAHPASAYIGGGDRFDASHHKDKYHCLREVKLEYAIDRHMHYLDARIKRFSDVHFGEVEGNHERHPYYNQKIRELADRYDGRLNVQTHFIRFANILFIHGDQAIRPHECYIDPRRPNDFSNADGRYNQFNNDFGFPAFYQKGYDFITRHLTRLIGEQFCLPEICAPLIIKWCSEYDAAHPGCPSILDGVDHIVSGDTHYPYVGFPYTLPGIISDEDEPQPKLIYFHNTGVNASNLYNPMSLFLDKADVFASDAKLVEIISLTQPRMRWSLEQSEFEHEQPARKKPNRIAYVGRRVLNVA